MFERNIKFVWNYMVLYNVLALLYCINKTGQGENTAGVGVPHFEIIIHGLGLPLWS